MMKNILAFADFRTLQDFVTILAVLKRNNRTVEDLVEYVNRIRKSGKRTHAVSGMAPPTRCPKCNSPIKVYSVNTGPRTQVEPKELRRQRICTKCEWETFE